MNRIGLAAVAAIMILAGCNGGDGTDPSTGAATSDGQAGASTTSEAVGVDGGSAVRDAVPGEIVAVIDGQEFGWQEEPPQESFDACSIQGEDDLHFDASTGSDVGDSSIAGSSRSAINAVRGSDIGILVNLEAGNDAEGLPLRGEAYEIAIMFDDPNLTFGDDRLTFVGTGRYLPADRDDTGVREVDVALAVACLPS